jgi:hypothetical protein
VRAAPSEMWSPTRCSVLVRWGAYYLYHLWCVAAQDAQPADPATNCNTWGVVLTTGSESGRVHYPGGVQVIYTYEDGLRWSIQIASALANLHAQRPLIIHRDLKLDNVLLTGDLTSHSCAQSWSSTAAGRPVLCRAWCTNVLRFWLPGRRLLSVRCKNRGLRVACDSGANRSVRLRQAAVSTHSHAVSHAMSLHHTTLGRCCCIHMGCFATSFG